MEAAGRAWRVVARIGLAVGLAIGALVVASGLAVLTATCGYRSTSAESVAPGQPSGPQETRCVSALHPMAPALLLAAALALVAIVRGGGRATAIWVGGALAIITLPWFSLGLVGTLVGILLVVAGLRVPRAAPRDVAPGAAVSLALVGAATVVMFWIAPLGPGDAWFARPAPLLDLAAAALVLALLATRRAPSWTPLAAAAVGVAIFGWELGGFFNAASSSVFAVAFLLVAGVAALMEQRAASRRGRSTRAR